MFTYTVRDAVGSSCIQDVFNVSVFTSLPVTISSFNATLNKDKVLLNWSTSQENNNKYFTIEKSNDGTNFIFLGKVNGAGTSTVSHNYQLVDYTPWEGTNYYRLSQTNFDGSINNYEVKKVNYKSNKNFSAGILNNANGQIGIVIKTTKPANMQLKVVDMLGKEILKESFSVSSNGTVKSINLKTGVYIIVVSNDSGERISNKVVVQ